MESVEYKNIIQINTVMSLNYITIKKQITTKNNNATKLKIGSFIFIYKTNCKHYEKMCKACIL